MVLTKPELVAALQNEVRILLHLAGKVDKSKLDYRPTPKQRSTIELLQYMSMMGPTLLHYMLTGATDLATWTTAEQAAKARDYDATVAAIAAQRDQYASIFADVTDAELRAERPGSDGSMTSRGASIVSVVLCGCAAYRTQLFLYLKACGREELNTMNLWLGTDAPAPA